MIRHIFILIAMMAATLSASASRPTSLNPNFKFHSSFDNAPRKIVDTRDVVYFFVHQRTFNKTAYNGYYSDPSGAVFCYDKQNPSLGIYDIRNHCSLSGADMSAFDADVETGAFAIGYSDAGVDVKWPDGSVTYYDMVKNRTFYKDAVLNSVQIDPSTGDVWVGTAAGFIMVSADTRRVKHEASWSDSPVTSIIPAAGRIIAIINDKIYEADPSARLTRLKSFTEIANATSGIDGTPLRILPMSDNHFVYVTSSGVIALVTRNGSEWSVKSMAKDASILESNPVINGAERVGVPTKDGYLLSTSSKIMKLTRPSSAGTEPVLTTVSVPSSVSEYVGSYDNTTYWFYYPRGYFTNATLSGNTWSALAEPIRPAAPATCGDTEFVYSRNHGLLSVNCWGTYYQPQPKQPALLSSFKDGKWVRLDGLHKRPDFASSGVDKTLYDTYRNRYPVDDPMGVFIDPVYPDILHMGSTYCGVVHYNIADPYGKKPIWTTNTNSTFSNSTQAKTDLPILNNDVAAYAAGFDADSTMWIFQSTRWLEGDEGKKLHLHYMTAADRKGMLESGDPSASPAWKSITFPYTQYQSARSTALVLKHPANRGRMLISIWQGAPYISMFYNYGNIDDTSDDSLEVFSAMRSSTGRYRAADFGNRMVENPITGEIAFCDTRNINIIPPGSHPENGILNVKEFAIIDEQGNDGRLLDPFNPGAVTYDEYNRLWVGSIHSGIVGIDTETGKLVARYTVDNSPLPSSCILGLGWNPDTKTLFASTLYGIVEINVDKPQTTAASVMQEPFASPSTVSPDYGGTVAVRNVPTGVTLYVLDWNNNPVAILPAPTNGVTHWNLLDTEGNRVPTGQYVICDRTLNDEFPALKVSIVR